MSHKFVCLSLSTLALFWSAEAFAAGSSANAIFNGQVADTCILAAGNAGTLTSSADFTKLASTNAGGNQSMVNATATSNGYSIKTVAPSTFTSGDSSNVNFSTTYNLTGSTSAAQIPGTQGTKLNAGNSVVAVDLNAAKTSGTFTAGQYAAAVTVRCE